VAQGVLLARTVFRGGVLGWIRPTFRKISHAQLQPVCQTCPGVNFFCLRKAKAKKEEQKSIVS
jgi:hypothetical protein